MFPSGKIFRDSFSKAYHDNRNRKVQQLSKEADKNILFGVIDSFISIRKYVKFMNYIVKCVPLLRLTKKDFLIEIFLVNRRSKSISG